MMISKEIHEFGRITKLRELIQHKHLISSPYCETFVHSVQKLFPNFQWASLCHLQGNVHGLKSLILCPPWCHTRGASGWWLESPYLGLCLGRAAFCSLDGLLDLSPLLGGHPNLQKAVCPKGATKVWRFQPSPWSSSHLVPQGHRSMYEFWGANLVCFFRGDVVWNSHPHMVPC